MKDIFEVFEVFNSFLVKGIYLVGNNREFDVSDIFSGVLFIVCGGELMTIEEPSLSAMVTNFCP